MLRGHILTSSRFSEAKQRSAIMSVGNVNPIYKDELATAIKSLRAGNGLVVDSLRGLGRTEKAIREAVEEIHGKDAYIIDASTARTTKTDKICEQLIIEAKKALTNERRGPRKKTIAERRMPWDQIRPIYRDEKLTNTQVEERCSKGYAPISYATIRRKLGNREVGTGRPSKNGPKGKL